MLEVKRSSAWYSPTNFIVPTANLTATEVKKLAEREEIMDKVEAEMLKDVLWVKINSGIFKGTIICVNNSKATRMAASSFSRDFSWIVHADVDRNNVKRCSTSSSLNPKIVAQQHGYDVSKDWQFANTCLSIWHVAGNEPHKFRTGEAIFPEFFGSDVTNNSSLLIDYTGDEVFCLNTTKRPLTFEDRLGQDVSIGDLVVVALNYGAGLDICFVRGYADERRVVIQSVEDNSYDRIPLEKNATAKIMKMPMSLKDTAMMMKLSKT